MDKKPVLVIAPPEHETFYRSLPLWDERVEFRPIHDSFSLFDAPVPDLLLIDGGFQERQALFLLERIKHERADIPIIVLTETGSDKAAISAYRLGARHYIRKPVGLFELKGIIELLLSIKRSSRETRVPLLISGSDDISHSRTVTNDTPENVLRAVRMIENGLSEPLSVEMLAREAGLSRYHFCRVFRKSTGMTPMAFVSRLRIERARELLRKGKPVSLVCMEAGFNDLSNFIRNFKRATGCTPGIFKSGSGFKAGPGLKTEA